MPHPANESDGLLRRILDAVPTYLFVLDGDARIRESNASAKALYEEDPRIVLRHRFGDVLKCLQSVKTSEGCGQGEDCRNCVIRNAVGEAIRGRSAVRRPVQIQMIRGEARTELYALVTAAPFSHDGEDLAVVTLEDIGDVVSLRRLIPICSGCKKVRTDEGYWTQVEAYLKAHLAVEFSHSYCPECYRREMDLIERAFLPPGPNPPAKP
ncbi:MAG: hypothetical protein AAB215_05505 [Planctomycetota bacterium]